MIEHHFIQQAIKKMDVEHYLARQLGRAGFCGMTLTRTPVVSRITLRVTRPGLAIGKKGKNIAMLTRELEERFDIRNPQIEIQEVTENELNATATVDKVVALLSRGYSWRSIAYRTVEDLIRAGAQGVELRLKGKLAGKGGRKKSERIARGYMKKSGGYAELVEYAQGAAHPKAGAIGVKLRVIRPGVVFPDKVDMAALLKEKLEKEEEAGETTEGKAGAKEERAGEGAGKETAPEKAAEKEKDGEKEPAGVEAGREGAGKKVATGRIGSEKEAPEKDAAGKEPGRGKGPAKAVPPAPEKEAGKEGAGEEGGQERKAGQAAAAAKERAAVKAGGEGAPRPEPKAGPHAQARAAAPPAKDAQQESGRGPPKQRTAAPEKAPPAGGERKAPVAAGWKKDAGAGKGAAASLAARLSSIKDALLRKKKDEKEEAQTK